MKASFFEYHRPTKEQFEELWRTAIFSFDASVLLDLYRFSSVSREELLKLLRTRRDRIWLTHQSAHEFHTNRIQVIAEAGKRALDLRTSLTSLQQAVSTDFKQHPFVTSELCDEISAACAGALKKLQEAEVNYPNLLSDDPIANDVLEIFDGRVGKPYDPNKLANIHAQIAARYDLLTPPGYRDRKTKDEQKSYGDCILWFQLIAYAKEFKCPVILVTRDMKDDWWLREGGKTLMPRPELRREFRESTEGHDFYMYQATSFIEFAKAYRGSDISDRLLQESRVIAEASEVKRAEQRATAEGGEVLVRKTLPSNEGPLTSDSLKISISELERLFRGIERSFLKSSASAKPKAVQGDDSVGSSSSDAATGETGNSEGNVG